MADPLQIGRHRSRMVLQSLLVPPNPEVFDSYGQPIKSWTQVANCWCFVEPLLGNELVAAKQVKAQAQIQVTFRWLGSTVTVTPENRILLTNPYSLLTRQLGIFEVRNKEERYRYYVATCHEIQQSVSV